MQFVVDEEIPFGREAFSHLGSVTLLPGRAMTREALRGAHGLIVRSVTKVDATLLADTTVQFVGTATTGVEHIDREYLAARDIGFARSPRVQCELRRRVRADGPACHGPRPGPRPERKNPGDHRCRPDRQPRGGQGTRVGHADAPA